jgi:hypothetical protein
VRKLVVLVAGTAMIVGCLLLRGFVFDEKTPATSRNDLTNQQRKTVPSPMGVDRGRRESTQQLPDPEAVSRKDWVVARLKECRSQAEKGCPEYFPPREPWELLAVEFQSETLEYIRELMQAGEVAQRRVAAGLLTALAKVQSKEALELLRQLAPDPDEETAVQSLHALSRYPDDGGVVLSQLMSSKSTIAQAAIWLAGQYGSAGYQHALESLIRDDIYVGISGEAQRSLTKIRIMNSSHWEMELARVIEGQGEYRKTDWLTWASDIALSRGATSLLPALQARLTREMESRRIFAEDLRAIAQDVRGRKRGYAPGSVDSLLWTIHKLGGEIPPEGLDLLRSLGILSSARENLESMGFLKDCPK